ncbi:MAG: hypothetical protein HYR67_09155 [Bacteroidetes bacterium]|nr:hypothetical protein [Bacteroidota bacterium]
MSAKYITDKKGKKIEVVLSVKDFKKILEELDELACIREFDRVTKRKINLTTAYDFFKKMDAKRG